MSTDCREQDNDKQVELWKVKKLINTLQTAKGSGTSMISLIVPPKTQISRVTTMLGEEAAVQNAITWAQQKLKLYARIPNNGLLVFCGTISTEDGKEKRVSVAFEPFKPVKTFHYFCDNKFHLEALTSLLEDDDTFGFIVMDGNGTLFATLQGNVRTILHKFTVDLPKKHGRGGQSALRFARLRLEKRHNYVRKVSEFSTQFFINENKCNVTGLVLAGSADFKQELLTSELLDPRLSKAVLQVVDVSYGMEPGLNQAVELASESLSNVKLLQEKLVLQKFFQEISQDTGKYCYMVQDTLQALDMGAIDTLIVWEGLAVNRIVVKDTAEGVQSVLHLTPAQEENDVHFHNERTGVQLEVVERVSLVDWLIENYKSFGCTLHFVSDRSQEGSQFSRGFGGIGGLLRWKVEFQDMELLADLDVTAGDAAEDFM